MTPIRLLARTALVLGLGLGLLAGASQARDLEADARRLLSHSKTAARFRDQLGRIRHRLETRDALTGTNHTYVERSAALYTRMDENMLEFVEAYRGDVETCPIEELVMRGAAQVNRYENAAAMVRLFEVPLAAKRYDAVAAQQDFVKTVRARFADRRTASELLVVADALVKRRSELGAVRDDSTFGELMRVTLDAPSLAPVGEPSMLKDASRWTATKIDNMGLRFGAAVDSVLYGASKIFGNLAGSIRCLGKPEIAGENLERVEKELMGLLRPGDILLDKTRFALTDRLIPGYFCHVAVWIGTPDQIRAQGLFDRDRNSHLTEAAAEWQDRAMGGNGVLEALRPGVEINPLGHFIQVDDVAVMRIRPEVMSENTIKGHLRRGMKWVGTDYDFGFDVNSGDRIVCSELVYQIYPLRWPTSPSVGRQSISPDQVASLCGPTKDFPLELIYWVRGEARRAGDEAYRMFWQELVDEGMSIPEGAQGEAIRALGVTEKK